MAAKVRGKAVSLSHQRSELLDVHLRRSNGLSALTTHHGMPVLQCPRANALESPALQHRSANTQHAAHTFWWMCPVVSSGKWLPPLPPAPPMAVPTSPGSLTRSFITCASAWNRFISLRGGTHTAAQTVWCGAVSMGVCVSHPPRIGMKCCDTPDTASGSCSFCFLLSFGCVSPCESKRWNDWEPGWRQDSTRDRNTPLGSEGRPGGRDLPSSPFISPSFPLHVQLDKNLSSHSR